MLKKNKKDERRLFPRLEKKLPIRVAVNGYDFSTSTLDLSCVGAYCNIKKYMPPFTKVLVKLNLPVEESREQKWMVECKGIVVRTDDETSGGFNVAIFFNEINDSQRKKISRYINQFLPAAKTPCAC